MKRSVGSLVVLGAFISAAFAAPASAHWQYTKWGMTPEQIASASAGLVKVDGGAPGQQISGYKVTDTGLYEASPRAFDVAFYSASEGLSLIQLTLKLPTWVGCNALLIQMRELYGVPFASRTSMFGVSAKWNHAESGNRVSIDLIGDRSDMSCYLKYEPLSSPSASGL